MYTYGFDLSHWDGVAVWKDIPAELRFVFMKFTEGTWLKDDKAPSHWAGAGSRNILRGPYHFWRYSADARAQATYYKAYFDQVTGGNLELPPVIDLEDTSAPKYGTDLKNRMRAVVGEVERVFQRQPIIYTAGWWTNGWVGDVSFLNGYPIWIADYTFNPYGAPRQAYYPKGLDYSKWKFWQYSDRGEIPGIPENDEDLDAFNGSYSDLLAFCGLVEPALTLEEKVDRLVKAHPELFPELN